MITVRCETITPGTYPLALRVRAHELRADVGPDLGGEDTAPGAHDYFDLSLATCKAHTAMWYAKRKGMALERVDVTIDSDNTEERRGVYKMHVRIAFHGDLSDDERAQLARAAAACPVTKLMTTSDVQIETQIV